jgi:hypothetical protein
MNGGMGFGIKVAKPGLLKTIFAGVEGPQVVLSARPYAFPANLPAYPHRGKTAL